MTSIGPRDPAVESLAAYIARVVATAPPMSPELAQRIAKLLPLPRDATSSLTSHRRTATGVPESSKR